MVVRVYLHICIFDVIRSDGQFSVRLQSSLHETCLTEPGKISFGLVKCPEILCIMYSSVFVISKPVSVSETFGSIGFNSFT